VKRACELIYTAERQALCDISFAGLRLKSGLSHYSPSLKKLVLKRARAGLLLFK
jgi:hypothetical protein